MKQTLLATTAIVLVAAQASAVDVELYGQVNKGLFGFDDGLNNDVVVVDNQFNSTRFGLKGAQALDNGWTASVLLEGEMFSNNSNTFTQTTPAVTVAATPANTGANLTERQARVGLSGMYGGFYLGQQTTAFDGTFTQDLVGAQDVMGASFNEIGGGLLFRAAGTNALTARGINTMSYQLDENRTDSIRYDSPIFNGFQGRVSVAQGGDMDAGVYYDGGMGDFKVAAAAGAYMNNDDVDQRGTATSTVTANRDDAHYAASVSLAHTSGLAGTLAYATDSLERKTAGIDEPDTWYAKVGYSWDAFEVAADYGVASDYQKSGLADDELTSVGLGAQYNLAEGVSVAALYRNFSTDVTAVPLEDINLYGVNMRVKF